jgi:hypothetical protein
MESFSIKKDRTITSPTNPSFQGIFIGVGVLSLPSKLLNRVVGSCVKVRVGADVIGAAHEAGGAKCKKKHTNRNGLVYFMNSKNILKKGTSGPLNPLFVWKPDYSTITQSPDMIFAPSHFA